MPDTYRRRARLLGPAFNARLTLETGVPFSVTEQLAKTTVYLTPLTIGNVIDLYTSSIWRQYRLSEINVAVPATTVTPFDVFVYDNAGTLTLEAVSWTNDTTRATALALQDGVHVKTGSTNKRYCGTGRTTGSSGQTELSLAKQLLWNAYNRSPWPMRVLEATDNWSYTTATFRSANNLTTNRLEMMRGLNVDRVVTRVYAMVGNASALAVSVGIGVDSTSVNSADEHGVYVNAGINTQTNAIYKGFPGLGFHYLQWLEKSAATGTTTWYGDNADDTYFKHGIYSEAMC